MMAESMWPELDDLEQRLASLSAVVPAPAPSQPATPTDHDFDRAVAAAISRYDRHNKGSRRR